MASSLFSQDGIEVVLEPIEISSVGGVQSYACGTYEGKWLIVGGRLDGLHRRQPWASFDEAGHNDQLMVIDPITEQSWNAPLTSLPISIQEQLSSTNMEFMQVDEMLYIVGGYGFSATEDDHITYPYLTAINLSIVVDAIVNGNSISNGFRQIEDETLAVTGGYLEMIGDVFHLVGGQRFDGRYNPMGNPTFVQEYTDAVHRFTISDNGTDLSLFFQDSFNDSDNLHRRDFNVVPQIMPDGSEGLTAFSGVFQVSADIPFLSAVNIDANGYAVQAGFSQYYNHYHCANVPLYSATNNEMHNLFFGGIAQYYDDNGVLVQDNEVPFVNTIARVSRTADGTMSEFKLPQVMPALLGSGAEFIMAEGVASYPNGVLDLDFLENDTNMIGYIYGGIESSQPNIFWINTGNESTANASIFKVSIVRTSVGLDELNSQSNGGLQMQIYPNPYKGRLNIDFSLDQPQEVKVGVYSLTGRKIYEKNYRKGATQQGRNRFELKLDAVRPGTTYLVTLESEGSSSTQKLIINE